MNNKHPLILLAAVTFLFLLFATACTSIGEYKLPLAPTMDVPTSTIAASIDLATAALPDTSNSIPGVEIELPTNTPVTQLSLPTHTPVLPTARPTNTPEMKKTCGESGSKIVVFVGSDVLGSSKPNGADSVRLIKVDFDAQSVKIITFPRDLIVNSGSVNSANSVQEPLGLAYYNAFNAAPGTPLEKNAVGAGVIAQLLRDNFSVEPQYYITVQMDKLAAMIDTVGGVEVTIPAAVTTEHNISFAAGTQTLNGAMATEYVRFINPGGEAGRTARQNEVINALQAKLININILPQIPTLLTQFKDALITDMSAQQLSNLACLALTMPKTNVTFGAIASPDLMNNNIPDTEKIKTYLKEVLGN